MWHLNSNSEFVMTVTDEYLYRVVDLLLMAHKGDAQLNQLIESQPGDLVHADHPRRGEVVAVPSHFQATKPGVH